MKSYDEAEVTDSHDPDHEPTSIATPFTPPQETPWADEKPAAPLVVGDKVKTGGCTCTVAKIHDDGSLDLDIIPAESDGVTGTWHRVLPAEISRA